MMDTTVSDINHFRNFQVDRKIHLHLTDYLWMKKILVDKYLISDEQNIFLSKMELLHIKKNWAVVISQILSQNLSFSSYIFWNIEELSWLSPTIEVAENVHLGSRASPELFHILGFWCRFKVVKIFTS